MYWSSEINDWGVKTLLDDLRSISDDKLVMHDVDEIDGEVESEQMVCGRSTLYIPGDVQENLRALHCTSNNAISNLVLGGSKLKSEATPTPKPIHKPTRRRCEGYWSNGYWYNGPPKSSRTD